MRLVSTPVSSLVEQQTDPGQEGQVGTREPRCATATVVAVIPAYNEERFIGSVVLRTRKHADAVVVVDDGSTDATAEVAEAAGALVVRHEQNLGKAMALNTGFRKAKELGPQTVVTVDGDGQHTPEEMPLVIAPILKGEADIVIGSRYLDKRSLVPRHRVWGHQIFTFLTNAASGVAVTDSQSGFRAFSRRAMESLCFGSHGFSVESEMQFAARENGLRVMEAPITICYHEKPKRNVMLQGFAVLNGLLGLVGQRRPLLFFGVPGLFLLFAGLVWGLWVVDIYRRVQILAVGYGMISILLCLVGTLAVFAGTILHSIRGLLLDLLRQEEMRRTDRIARPS